MSIPTTRAEVRSDEEISMVYWLQEAVEHGLVESWEYEPKEFCLVTGKNYDEHIQKKTKIKVVERHLHKPLLYTPDFRITLSELGISAFSKLFKHGILTAQSLKEYGTIWIDVKGVFNPYQGDDQLFKLKQKVLFQEFGIWAQKVIPYDSKKKNVLFKQTFAPDRLRWMKHGKGLNVVGRNCFGIKEYMDKLSNDKGLGL